MAVETPVEFPCALTLDVPFPDARLAGIALRVLRVDKELSNLVTRNLSTVASEGSSKQTVLRVEYRAATNRMLRVAVNAFLDNVALVTEVMGGLDEDVIDAPQPQGESG
ncbi:transcription factor Pcc1-domain-containing protein [Chaetomium strumarium]|uniref:Transcription factor Pcc1-domain-containing protein n=1 Tax=Chaetomium strumarium TaxID=1170767 RepID=A0AAJ0M5F4_9PEZI|nr:transcription factor Pcc1-domain-containing protein [Chaetomium strumarium]